jgi:sugar-specific transcriptional regulator TrmB
MKSFKEKSIKLFDQIPKYIELVAQWGKCLLAEEEIKLFANIGLTYLQAKVYLTLVNSGEATAKCIAVQARMDRPDVYRVIDGLVNQGFVEKRVQNPVRFKAFPIEEVVDTLLKRKQAEINSSKKKATKLIRRYKSKRQTSAAENKVGNFFYTLIPGDPDTIDKTAGKIIENSRTLLDFVCVDIEPHVIGFQPLEQFLENGGKNRILAYNRNTAMATKVLQAHKEGAIEIRFTSEPPVVALIGDQREVSITCSTSEGIDLKKMECLYTNSPAITQLAVDYFEKLWKKAKIFHK